MRCLACRLSKNHAALLHAEWNSNSWGLCHLLDNKEGWHESGQWRVKTKCCSLAMADSFGSEAPAVAVMDAVSLFPWEVILLSAKAAGEKWHFDLQGHNTAVI